MPVSESREAGKYDVVWRGNNERGLRVASGVYFYRFQAGETVIKEKLLLLK